MEHVTELGEVVITDEGITIPLKATKTGTFEFITNYNGAYIYRDFECVEGENIVIPVTLLPDEKYTFKIYEPDTTLLGKYSMITKKHP